MLSLDLANNNPRSDWENEELKIYVAPIFRVEPAYFESQHFFLGLNIDFFPFYLWQRSNDG